MSSMLNVVRLALCDTMSKRRYTTLAFIKQIPQYPPQTPPLIQSGQQFRPNSILFRPPDRLHRGRHLVLTFLLNIRRQFIVQINVIVLAIQMGARPQCIVFAAVLVEPEHLAQFELLVLYHRRRCYTHVFFGAHTHRKCTLSIVQSLTLIN